MQLRPAQLLYACLLAAVALGALGCGGPARPADIPTCAPSEILDLPGERAPALLFVLVDRSSSYVDQIRPALDLTAGILEIAAKPGDRVVGAWVGSRSGQPTETFFNEKIPLIAPPSIEQAPTPPVYSKKQTEGARIKAKREFETECGRYRTEYAAWAKKSRTALSAWSEEQDRSRSAFVKKAATSIRQAPFEIDSSGTLIQEALYDASNAFSLSIDGARYERKALVIFSDLVEYRGGKRDAEKIDLRGVQVIAAAVPYDRPKDFTDMESRWTKQFELYQAKSVTILPIRASTIEGITARLKDGR